ncbi:hypothetical protein J4448_04920 [Candidatus Woesearchaeota archaeon]|nr:hypothetical protein [Candidatus Woesearchaeota archaeon]
MGTQSEFANVEFLITTPPPKKDVFFLADHLVLKKDGRCYPRYYPTKYSAHADIFGAIRESYPKNMLPSVSKLYAIVEGKAVASDTKKDKIPADLEAFISHIENVGGSAAVVSFSQGDFDEFLLRIGNRNFWGIREEPKEGILYKIHTYSASAKRAPPKYYTTSPAK